MYVLLMSEDPYKLEIPEVFYSDAEGKPFERCQVCDKYLLEPGSSYMIEKAFRNYEGYDFNSTIFEYAICMDCYAKIQKSMSSESVQNLQKYYMQVMAERQNQPILIDVNNFKIEDWTKKCFFKGDSVEGMEEYQLVAQFNGDGMVLNIPPMVVGDRAIEEMAGLLSNDTLGEIDGFRQQFLGPDPEIEELFNTKKLLLI